MKENSSQAERQSKPWSETEDRFIVDWKRSRAQVEHEDHLIHNRMTWLLQSQAVLFAGFAATVSAIGKDSLKQDFMIFLEWMFTILPLVGLSICWTIGRVVDRALCQINNIHEWWQRREQLDNGNLHPPIIGTEGISLHRRYLAIFMPGWLAVVWLGVLVAFHKRFLFDPRPAVLIPALSVILLVGAFAGGWYARSQKAKAEK